MRRNNRRNVNVSVAYNVTAPAGTRLRASSISGSITAQRHQGRVSRSNRSAATCGSSTADGSPSAKSISGNVEINDTEIDGSSRPRASAAACIAAPRQGAAARSRIDQRQRRLEDVECERVEAQSVSGNVEIRRAAREGRPLRAELALRRRAASPLGGRTGFELEATSFSGSIRSDFSVQTTPGGPGDSRRRKSIRGVYGDGSAVLELTTFSGSIVITKR